MEGFSRIENSTTRTTILGEIAGTQVSLRHISGAGPAGVVVEYCEKCYHDTATGQTVCQQIPCPDDSGGLGDEGSFGSLEG